MILRTILVSGPRPPVFVGSGRGKAPRSPRNGYDSRPEVAAMKIHIEYCAV